MAKKIKEESKADKALIDARDEVIAAMPEIVKKIIEKAKEGSYQHAKFLMEFAGSGPSDAIAEDEESLAKMLMKELRDEPAA